ncbi:hypothetical protein [Sphingomonas jaspsi]|uniref:hypothetical protein n=1 Tax=Sphingomonas jaspsi TaxID=392409 RepID=UPI0004B26F91|nr:hypothetical protein [Sphingomonas jaspsi]
MIERFKKLFASRPQAGHFVPSTDEELWWLLAQLTNYPTRVDEARTTSISFLLNSAAATLHALTGDNVVGIALRIETEDDFNPQDLEDLGCEDVHDDGEMVSFVLPFARLANLPKIRQLLDA